MTWALFDKLDGKWKQFVGVDISPKSVELYNQKAATQFTPEEMQAVCTELNGKPGELDGQTFDVIVVSRLFLAPNYPILTSSRYVSVFGLLSQVLASLPPLCGRGHHHPHPRLLPQAGWQAFRSGPHGARQHTLQT